MRIAIGGFSHETNRFGSVPVDMDTILACTREGEDLLKVFTGSHSYIGAYIDEAREQGVQLVPIRHTFLKPSGPCVPEGVAYCRDQLAEQLAEAYAQQPFDGIALFMHGAGAAEGFDDIEGAMLQAIREKLGKEIPIGLALDLHGNITPEMMEHADLLMGCMHYPHIDEYDTGRKMFRTLCDMIRNNYRPYKKLIQLPWHLVSLEGLTISGPARDVQQLCYAKEQEDPDLLQVSFFQGFPYADVPAAGVSFVAMAKTRRSAEENATQIARYAWERREDFRIPVHSAQEAVDLALAVGEGPVLINESSDNPGGGTPGDGTHLLRELLGRNVSAAFGFIYDPEVVALAIKAGVGNYITCNLGGKTDNLHGAPILLENAYVKSLSDGKFRQMSPMGYGSMQSIGPTACLVVGNVQIVVAGPTISRTQTFDDGPFRIAGVDWQHTRILALKSAQHFRGWWQDKVKAIVPCDSPGVFCADLKELPFQTINWHYYPYGDAQWQE